MLRAYWCGVVVTVLAATATAEQVCREPSTKGICEALVNGEMRVLSEEELDDGRYRLGSLSSKSYRRVEESAKPIMQLGLESETRLVPRPPDPLACKIDGSLSYSQRGDEVHVDAVIENDDCAASSGRYRIRVTARDEQDVRVSDSHHESWSRGDAEPVTVTHSYPLVPNGELVRVSLRPTDGGCRCSAVEAVLE
jgi:hypothetical protein